MVSGHPYIKNTSQRHNPDYHEMEIIPSLMALWACGTLGNVLPSFSTAPSILLQGLPVVGRGLATCIVVSTQDLLGHE